MTKNGALDGIKVLDLSSVLMGPLAAQMLGDMGAEVIKIESPEGDLTRIVGPSRSKGMAALFLSLNRNKRSIVLDLKNEEARKVLARLVKGCDVVLHSVRGAALDSVGMDYQTLSALNPGLIYCHLKGFSDEGLYAGRPAYDDMIQALSGIAHLQSVISGQPRFVPCFVADKLCGVYATQAICMALIHKLRTGRGQKIDLSMFETVTAFNLVEHLAGHVFETPAGPMGYPNMVSGTRRPQRTKDGFVSLWPVTDAQWKRLFELVDRADLIKDSRCNTLEARVKSGPFMLQFFDEVLPLKTTDEWIGLCEALDLPIARVNSLEDLLIDPHLASIDFWKIEEHPTEGALRMVPNTIKFSDSPASIRRHAPRHGEHTREILGEFSYSEEDIRKLSACGAIPAESAE